MRFSLQQRLAKLSSYEIRMEFFASNCAEWASLNLNYNSNDWRSVWISGCHALWFWRNEEEHNNNFLHPLEPIIQFSKRCWDYKQAIALHKSIRNENSGTIPIGWIPPCRSMIKLNTDGACKSDSSSGFQGILWYHNGDWKGGFSKFMGRSSALLSEFWGVYEGLKLAQRLNYFKV